MADPEQDVREQAHLALREMWPHSTEAIPEFLQIIRNPIKKIDRQWAIVSIMSVGPDAREAVPILKELLPGADLSRRKWLEHVIRSIS